MEKAIITYVSDGWHARIGGSKEEGTDANVHGGTGAHPGKFRIIELRARPAQHEGNVAASTVDVAVTGAPWGDVLASILRRCLALQRIPTPARLWPRPCATFPPAPRWIHSTSLALRRVSSLWATFAFSLCPTVVESSSGPPDREPRVLHPVQIRALSVFYADFRGPRTDIALTFFGDSSGQDR